MAILLAWAILLMLAGTDTCYHPPRQTYHHGSRLSYLQLTPLAHRAALVVIQLTRKLITRVWLPPTPYPGTGATNECCGGTIPRH